MISASPPSPSSTRLPSAIALAYCSMLRADESVLYFADHLSSSSATCRLQPRPHIFHPKNFTSVSLLDLFRIACSTVQYSSDYATRTKLENLHLYAAFMRPLCEAKPAAWEICKVSESAPRSGNLVLVFCRRGNFSME